jgi:DNA-binding CsgD family transcriptional regulator
MVPEKLIQLEQINTAIKMNSCRSAASTNSGIEQNPNADEKNDSENECIHSSENKGIIASLELRIEMLENENNRLLFFIHFLYKNFPELVIDILPQQQKNTAGPISDAPVVSVEKKDNSHPPPMLTKRETEVMNLLVKGLGAKEIASKLFICESTVITHKKNLKEKFNARNTAELISKAFHINLDQE